MKSASVVEIVKKKRLNLYDFASEKAANGRSAIHDYPAMLHYLLVQALIEKYAKPNDIIYDPFCGSGVTIVEALKKQHRVIGTDINPLALLVAEVRTFDLNGKVLLNYLNNIIGSISKSKPDIPGVKNIEYWFQPPVIQILGKLRSAIKRIEDEQISKFFKVIFSQTVRNVSNNRKGEFKRFRIPNDKLSEYEPEVLNTFIKLSTFYAHAYNDKIANDHFELYKHDVRNTLPFKEKINFIITSPPYGDSRTTVAYGQFSSFSLDWLNGMNPYGNEDLKLDAKMLGGKREPNNSTTSKTLQRTINKIKDQNRKLDVITFFNDLNQCCYQINKVLSKNAKVCFVVGNRNVDGVEIPMDQIVVDFFEELGLKHQETLIRKISNKRMPSKNSPSNKKGFLSSTMLNEYIVILDK